MMTSSSTSYQTLFRLSLLLIGIISSGSKFGLASFFDQHAHFEYGLINQYLLENAGELDADDSMLVAMKWFHWLRQNLNKLDGPLGALEQFTALRRIGCNRDGQNVIALNDEATGGRAHLRCSIEHDLPLTKVELIVHHFAHEHAKKCREIYADQFRKKITADKEAMTSLVYVFSFLEKMIQVREESRLPEFVWTHKFISSGHNSTIDLSRDANSVLRVIDGPERKLTRSFIDTKRGKAVVNNGKVKDLFANLIVKPCQEYSNRMANIFEMANYDYEILDDQEKFTLNDQDFYKAWAGFRVCKDLLEKKTNKSLINDVLEFAKSRANYYAAHGTK